MTKKSAPPRLDWDSRFAQLVEFRRAHGHFVLDPRGTNELSRWASRQRELHRSGRLDPLLKRQLREVGFPLEIEACQWEQWFARALSFKAQWDHLRPSRPTALAKWLAEQRARRDEGALPEDRAARLAELEDDEE
ncbi:MAG: helicase associated domain-containing protein [Myxococcales bacterium]